MIDYEFYTNTYLGSVIPEKAFPAAALRAKEALWQFRRSYQITPTDSISEKMAICAMAETVYEFSGRKAGVTGATVGNVSVRYNSRPWDLQHQLLEKARIYLDIYRGVC